MRNTRHEHREAPLETQRLMVHEDTLDLLKEVTLLRRDLRYITALLYGVAWGVIVYTFAERYFPGGYIAP